MSKGFAVWKEVKRARLRKTFSGSGVFNVKDLTEGKEYEVDSDNSSGFGGL